MICFNFCLISHIAKPVNFRLLVFSILLCWYLTLCNSSITTSLAKDIIGQRTKRRYSLNRVFRILPFKWLFYLLLYVFKWIDIFEIWNCLIYINFLGRNDYVVGAGGIFIDGLALVLLVAKCWLLGSLESTCFINPVIWTHILNELISWWY